MHFHLTSNVSHLPSNVSHLPSNVSHFASNCEAINASHIFHITSGNTPSPEAKVYVAVLKFKHTVKKKK